MILGVFSCVLCICESHGSIQLVVRDLAYIPVVYGVEDIILWGVCQEVKSRMYNIWEREMVAVFVPLARVAYRRFEGDKSVSQALAVLVFVSIVVM